MASDLALPGGPAAGGAGPGLLSRFYHVHERLLLGIAGILLVLVPWELVSRLGLVKQVIASSPTLVAAAFVKEIQRGTLWPNIWPSLQVWIIGFTVAAVVGILLGLVAGWYRRAGLIAVPWLQTLYAAPNLAFVPIFILWFGLGLTFKVWIVFFGTTVYVALNTIAGVHATEERYLAVARTYGASNLRIFQSIIIPGSIPYIMAGLRIASGHALVGVVGSEFISAHEGIGFFISISGTTLQTARVFVGLVLLAGFGVFLNEALGRVERRFDPWRREVHG